MLSSRIRITIDDTELQELTIDNNKSKRLR